MGLVRSIRLPLGGTTAAEVPPGEERSGTVGLCARGRDGGGAAGTGPDCAGPEVESAGDRNFLGIKPFRATKKRDAD